MNQHSPAPPLPLALRIWLRASRVVPLPVLHGLGYILGGLAAWLPNHQRRIAAINLRQCLPGLTGTEQRRLLRRSLCESGKALMELGALWTLPADRVLRKIREVDGLPPWKFNIDSGCIVITPHIGAWEVVGLWLSTHHSMAALYRPSRIGAAFDGFTTQARERAGAHLYPATAKGVRGLLLALNDGMIAGVLPDQDPAKESGEFVPFFERPAMTMTLVAKLSQKHHLPVFLVTAERLSWARGYRIRVSAIPEIAAAPTMQAALREMNAAVETAILACPEQYLWSYKRFKTTPPGMANLYRR